MNTIANFIQSAAFAKVDATDCKGWLNRRIQDGSLIGAYSVNGDNVLYTFKSGTDEVRPMLFSATRGEASPVGPAAANDIPAAWRGVALEDLRNCGAL